MARHMRKFLKLLPLAGFVSSTTYVAFSNSNDEQSRIWQLFAPIVQAKSSLTSPRPWNKNWDRELDSVDSGSSNSKFSDKDPQFTRHLILIRHGQYHFGKTDTECMLTELGQEQARLTGRKLKEMNLPYTKLVYSTMTRATQTAEGILESLPPNIPVESTDLLREGAPCPPEPPLPGYNPTQEDFMKDGARIEAAFRKYFHRAPLDQKNHSYEIYVCHANVIRYFLCRVLQFPPEAWLRFSLDHGSITWVTIRPNGNVGVRYIGSSGHMPYDKVSIQ